MKNYLFSILITVTIVGCNDTPKPTNNLPQDATETPTAFTEKSTLKLSSLRNYNQNNLVDNLYQEALSNNETLEQLEESIEELYEVTNDSIADYADYRNLNELYYRQVAKLLGGISDSSLVRQLEPLVHQSEARFTASMAEYDHKNMDLENNQKRIADLHALLKITTTLPMVAAFQQNEHPSMSPLQNVLKQQEHVIHQLEKETLH